MVRRRLRNRFSETEERGGKGLVHARLLHLAPFLAVALGVVLVPFSFSGTPTTRHVTLSAEQYAFHPSVVRVNRGDRVVFDLHATDVVHGLYIDDYGVDVRFEPGVTEQVEFVASKVGKFRYRCSVACGTLHPFMIGELVVGPNQPYVRAVGLALVVLAATLYML
jgi:heme/copper-type cytochrome/quinol oxidase subunit 2